jgi:hypothetical protein
LQTLQVVLVFIFALRAVEAFDGLLRRQATDPCLATSCSWFTTLDNCSETNNTCFCDIILSVGSTQVSACATCEQAENATLAGEISESYQGCETPDTDTDPCLSGACSWMYGLDSCSDSDDTCFCEVVLAAGPSNVSACASCEQSSNATYAQQISSSYQECEGSNSSSASTPTAEPTDDGTTTNVANTASKTPTTVTAGSTAKGQTTSGSGGIHRQVEGAIWVGILTLSVIVVGLVGLV